MSLILTVHRGTRQIGGSCIEIAHPDGERLILDAGRPLDAPEGATGLLPVSLDRSRPATVLISHPHQDHWGLVEELPPAWPVWTGSKSAALITVTSDDIHLARIVGMTLVPQLAGLVLMLAATLWQSRGQST